MLAQWNSPSDVRKAEFHPSTIFHTYRAGGVKRLEGRKQKMRRLEDRDDFLWNGWLDYLDEWMIRMKSLWDFG